MVNSFLTFVFVLIVLTIFTGCVVYNKAREDKKRLPDLVFKPDEKFNARFDINKTVSLIGDDDEGKKTGSDRYSLN